MRIISSSSLFTFQERIDQIDSVTDQQIDDILTSLREDNHAARVLFFGNLNEDTSEYFDEAHRVYNDSEIFKYSLSPNFKPAYAYTFKL
jgi:hypothetical protein